MEAYGYIYLTTNKINDKRYIGQHKSKDWDYSYYGSGKYLKRAINKYGIESFTCFPLAWAWNKNELNRLEIEYIAHYKPEYNLTKGGQNNGSGPRSEETKRKLSKAHKGKKLSEEHKKKIGDSVSGEKNGFYGKHHTEETRKKIVEVNKGNKYHFGHKHTEETKQIIKEKSKGNTSHLGHKHTEETKKKCACNNGKHWFTNEIINIFDYKCPDGFINGRTKLKAA
jgi:group I intron endonuclease